jgi:hypothetical protein
MCGTGAGTRTRTGTAAAILTQMLLGTIWELLIPALVALVAVVLWLVRPALRQSTALRLVLITSVLVSAAELMLGALGFGAFHLSGGMENF